MEKINKIFGNIGNQDKNLIDEAQKHNNESKELSK